MPARTFITKDRRTTRRYTAGKDYLKLLLEGNSEKDFKLKTLVNLLLKKIPGLWRVA